MSIFLVQVGKATWVAPDAIKAIEWSGHYDCPKILLDSQQYVYATDFRDKASAATPNNAEACTNALLTFLWQQATKRSQL
jgi:hypothetical protein